jgi:hypothetical protein
MVQAPFGFPWPAASSSLMTWLYFAAFIVGMLNTVRIDKVLSFCRM